MFKKWLAGLAGLWLITSVFISAAQASIPLLTEVRIDPGFINGYPGVYRLSTLAYDQYNEPIWSGVTYDWGTSSTNSIGTFSQITGSIANFNAQNPGSGSLFVTAHYQGQTVTGAIPVTINSFSTIYTISDVIHTLAWYLSPQDQYFYLKDGKINMFDVGYIIGQIR